MMRLASTAVRLSEVGIVDKMWVSLIISCTRAVSSSKRRITSSMLIFLILMDVSEGCGVSEGIVGPRTTAMRRYTLGGEPSLFGFVGLSAWRSKCWSWSWLRLGRLMLVKSPEVGLV